MQLDNTRISVRERSLLETFDLALHVIKEFWKPWLVCSLLAIIPLALLNYALVGWMANIEWDEDFPYNVPWRFFWNMGLLIYMEAQVAASFVIAYLGPAVFLEKPTIRQVVREVGKFTPQLALCQLVLRGVLPVWLLYLTFNQDNSNYFVEGFLIPAIVFYATVVRAMRPNLSEIILLEKNPLTSKGGKAVTIGKRSSHLHDPSGGDLVARWLGAAALTCLLAGIVFGNFNLSGVLVGSFWLESFAAQVFYPAALWIVAAYIAVVRFLNYLDLRIRHEGWEVELLMRAEGMRLASKDRF